MSTQFQITDNEGQYDSPLLNVQRDFENLYWDTGAPNYLPVDLNEGVNILQYTPDENIIDEGKTYWWRVRFRDKNLQWSDWSAEYSFTFQTTSKVNGKNAIIKKSRLYENYPNPFNPQTTINFDIAHAGPVKLQIYSIEGKLVKTLVDGNRATGSYSVEWDGLNDQGRQVPSGIYFYAISSPGYYKVNRAVLVK
jgi:hypothetical protein